MKLLSHLFMSLQMPSDETAGLKREPIVVTLVVVNFNGKGCVERCLQGISNQVFAKFELIIVDNGSTDGSPEYIQKKHPKVRLLCLSDNSGFSRANNIAIRKANTEFVGLLNNDAIADPLWLSRLVKALREHPEAGFAASKMLYYDRAGVIDRAGDGYTRCGAGLLRGRGAPSTAYHQKEWIFGACAGAALYRKRMLEDIGFFDEDFFMLYEDVDVSFRAQLRGYKCIYVPDAVVYHMASRTLGYDSDASVYFGHRNLEWVYLKNMPGLLLGITFPMHLLYVLLSFAYFISKGKGKPFLKAKRDAIGKMKAVLVKRRWVQDRKTVSDTDIWRILDKERFHRRFLRRLKPKIGERNGTQYPPH